MNPLGWGPCPIPPEAGGLSLAAQLALGCSARSGVLRFAARYGSSGFARQGIPGVRIGEVIDPLGAGRYNRIVRDLARLRINPTPEEGGRGCLFG